MSLVWWIVLPLAVLFALYVGFGIYLGMVLKWEDEQTVGLRYYGLPPAERAAFKARLRRHARLLSPVLWLNARLAKLDFRRVAFRYKGVAAPHGSCSPESFARAEGYQPRLEDVFVVTQMKCGTTWMQHVVYEVLHRGEGNLVATGTAMYAVAPWLEGRKSVALEEAPLLGRERPSRILKTHLPAQLCPSRPEARYIYVARHPVSCFASCIDFVVTNVGAMAPGMAAFEEWYRSPELMWWGTWPDHVKGWWARSRRDGNVLYLYFEHMKQDLGGVVRQVAAFLGVAPLSEAELARVVEKCSFRYMQEHQDNFEMHPPHILQTNAELFVRGTADRHLDVPEDVRQRILAWSARELAGSDVPVATVYPDLRPQAGA
ncbi:MAG: sulfotransferase domain-containing protein [Gemmatimonadota bacterium]|nr:sulfotransferase domain-containing protein [Gemmatimonadota bacterium]